MKKLHFNKTIRIEITQSYVLINCSTVYDEDQLNTKISINLESIKNIHLLKDFDGEVKKISISLSYDLNKKSNTDYQVFEPFNEVKLDEKQMIFNVKYIKNYSLPKKMISHLDNEFNIFEYLGGLKPLIPFVSLINGIYENKKINSICRIEKNKYLKGFIFDIFYVLNKFCQEKLKIQNKNTYTPKTEDKLKKYLIFILYLTFQIDSEIIPEEIITLINENNENDENKINDNNNDFNQIKLFISNYKLNSIIKSFIAFYKEYSGEKIIDKMNENNNNIINFDDKKEIEKILLNNKYNLNQLYRHYIKELFIYNRYWSNRELFFGNKKNNKLKYKQLTYYTRNYQQPVLYPILEFDRNYPKFSNYTDNMFINKNDENNKINENDENNEINENDENNEKNEMINYNFNLEENDLSNEINKILSNKDNKNNFQQCCLIKKLYHVKGKVSVYEVDKKGGFNILFTADSDSNGPSCNNIDNLCLGPSFPCLEKEYNKKILIESKNILFILIRYYFRKQSGLEIFTCNPYKSYYFNFKEIIDTENINYSIFIL